MRLLLLLLFTLSASASCVPTEYVTIAILAKDKAHTLPLYLECIEAQTWPKHKTYLYIRTNNNNDETVNILKDWIVRVGHQYADIYFDDTDVQEPVEQFGQHEWNCTRFKVLGKIRQDSVDWAKEHNSHYFVVDCDNFIYPDTLSAMVELKLPIVAPFLRCYAYEKRFYSNYHDAIDLNGYYTPSVFYYDILDQKVRGIIEVLVVHCTYFIRYDVIDKICYDDESYRYEYVIFSDSARKQNVPQYIDNRKIYGYISFAESTQEFEEEAYDTFFKE
jgi:Glycosyl transferase family 2